MLGSTPDFNIRGKGTATLSSCVQQIAGHRRALAAERQLLDRSLTESRKHLIALLDASTDDLAESVLSEVISQIDLRFSDIASVDDPKQEAEVFQSVLTFSDFLDSSRIRLDAFGETKETFGAELQRALNSLGQELRGVLKGQGVQRGNVP